MTILQNNPVLHNTRVRNPKNPFIHGTIHYIGPVASSSNPSILYAGIEWDEPVGKHNGTVIHKNTQKPIAYFNTEERHASYVKLTKVDYGILLNSQTLFSRYVQMNDPLIAPYNMLPHVALTSRGNDKPIEFVGELNIRKKQQVTKVSRICLEKFGIYGVDLDHAMTNVTSLDLSHNFCPWSVLKDLICVFPMVNDLSLARNPLGVLGETDYEYTSITQLNVSNCSLHSFQTIQEIGRICQNIEQLSISQNFLSNAHEYPLSGVIFSNLKYLDCSSCCWSSQQLSSLTSLQLQTLILNYNSITTLDLNVENLQNLQIVQTKISSWSAIDVLLPLSSIRIQNTPLNDTGVGFTRMQIIARLPNVTCVNGSFIKVRERMESEKKYVAYVAGLLFCDGENEKSYLNQSTQEKVIEQNPRFYFLRQKHEQTISATQRAGIFSTLSSQTIKVKIISMAAQSCHIPPVHKQLPSTMTIGRLKSMITHIFRVDVECQRLSWRKGNIFPIECNNNLSSLEDFLVENESEILLNEIDVRAEEFERDSMNNFRKSLMNNQKRRIERHIVL